MVRVAMRGGGKVARTARWGPATMWPAWLQDARQGGEVAGVAGRGMAKSRMQLGGARRRGPCGWEGGGDGVHATGRGVAMWCVQL